MSFPTRKLTEVVTAFCKSWPAEKFWLCDVGAGGGVAGRWAPFRPLLHILGFEPNATEFAKLKVDSGDKFVNAAVADRDGEIQLNLTRFWKNSSVLEPNAELIRTLEWADAHDVVSRVDLPCVTLDRAAADNDVSIDFLKVDTQGSELDILRGSESQLASVVFIEIEVEFCELYRNQALFSDVDRFLRGHGFYLHEIGNILTMKPRGKGGRGGPKGRLVSADALYYRDPAGGSLTAHQQLALSLAYLIYGYPEECCRSLEVLAKMESGTDIQPLLAQLDALQTTPGWAQRLPGWDLACRIGKRMWHHGAPVHASHWDRPLGNG